MNYTIEKKKRLVVGSFIFFIVLFFGFYRAHYIVSGFAEQCGSCFLFPFLKLQQWCVQPVQRFFVECNRLKHIHTEFVDLRKKCEKLAAENTMLKATQAFFCDSKHVIEFQKRYAEDTACLAHIMTYHLSPQQHIAYIDVGVLSGVTTQMVAVYKNTVIGNVVAVYPWHSKLQLITDPQSKVSVYAHATGARGMYYGTGDLHKSFLMRVDHLELLCNDDELFTTGHGQLFPRGYKVGTMVSFEDQGVHYKAVVKPAFDPSAIRYCTLIGPSCGRDVQ